MVAMHRGGAVRQTRERLISEKLIAFVTLIESAGEEQYATDWQRPRALVFHRVFRTRTPPSRLPLGRKASEKNPAFPPLAIYFDKNNIAKVGPRGTVGARIYETSL